MLIGVLLLWFSGARAWDFLPSVNVHYATSLSPVLRPTGNGNNFNGDRDKAVLDSPPTAAAAAAVADHADGGDIMDVVNGIVA